MSIITTKTGLEKVDLEEGWDKIRFRLLRSSYILDEVVKHIRDKHVIVVDSKGKTNWPKVAFTRYWNDLVPHLEKWRYFAPDIKDNSEERGWRTHFALADAEKVILPEIPLLSDKLSMDEGYLRVFVLYNNRTNKVDGPVSMELMQVGDKVRQRGVYLRLDDIKSVDELRHEFEKYRDLYVNGLFKDDKEKLPKYMKPRKKVISREDYRKIDAYLRTQEELLYLSNPSNASEVRRAYDNKVGKKLGLAFERVVQNELGDADYVSEEDEEKSYREKLQEIRNGYNDVVERYRLPSLKELPSLLRLVDR